MIWWRISGSGGCIQERAETPEQAENELRAFVAKWGLSGEDEGGEEWHLDPTSAEVVVGDDIRVIAL